MLEKPLVAFFIWTYPKRFENLVQHILPYLDASHMHRPLPSNGSKWKAQKFIRASHIWEGDRAARCQLSPPAFLKAECPLSSHLRSSKGLKRKIGATWQPLPRRYSAGRHFGFSQAKALSLGSGRSAVSRETGKRLGAAVGVGAIGL